MTDHDIQLITSIVKFLAANPGASSHFVAPLAAQLAANPDPLAPLRQQVTQLQAEAEQWRQQYEALAQQTGRVEQLAAQLQTGLAQLPAWPETSPGQTEELRLVAQLTQQLQSRYFATETKLAKLLPGAHYHPAPGVWFYLFEKFGIPHLVLLTSPLPGEAGQWWATVSGFALQHIMATRRYVNSSHLIEEYLAFGQAVAGPPLPQVAVLIVDAANREVEFSSTGSPLGVVSVGQWTTHPGGLAEPPQPTKGQYRVQGLSLRAASEVLCYLAPGPLPAAWPSRLAATAEAPADRAALAQELGVGLLSLRL
ncbi:MAG: hypothetical protein MUC97_02405 [Bernardetiaceae bacterium]|jgi:hypothetical protein|nr:hypothetical protein [Bernardetiaceae bacterium]